MKTGFYKTLVTLSRLAGPWLFSLVSSGIAAGYFLFCPGRVQVGLHFYAALFPHRGRAYHLRCTWRQFQNFTSVFLDRLRIQDEAGIQYTFQGEQTLQAIIDTGNGGILLMSHMGNWEVAARLLQQNLKGLRLLLYMGARASQEIESLQKETVENSGIGIVGVDQAGGSPLDIIEGVRFLRAGGIVSMAGDVLWRDDQPAVEVDFLGKKARLPEAPFALAMVSGAPLIVFFAFRTGERRYHFQASEPIFIAKTDRDKRTAVIRAAARRYAALLEKAVQENPFQWYHFEPFLDSDGAAADRR
jgi:predicted LPLAT superfamily acyltransferase